MKDSRKETDSYLSRKGAGKIQNKKTGVWWGYSGLVCTGNEFLF